MNHAAGLSRRRFLGLLATGAAAACTGGGGDSSRTSGTVGTTEPPTTVVAVAAPPDPGLVTNPFTLGVASGDPLPDAVVLWTRLAPQPIGGGGMPAVDVPIAWEIAVDESFEFLIRSEVVTAALADAHTVHVDATGLMPARDYWYRFRVGDYVSPAGRTRTAPEAGATVDRLPFAFASCQDWQDGFYPAHRHLSGEDVDVVLFLGDYIYEGGVDRFSAVRQHDGPRAETLAAYRDRYALYKGDRDLQAAHAAAPWIVIWDDHEVSNQYGGDTPLGQQSAEEFTVRRAAAYRAWWEHQPVRLPPPNGADLQIYRRFDFGGLLSVLALDGRQYRDPAACGGDIGITCSAVDDPARTLLGAEQESWLLDGLEASDARWNVLANDVMMTNFFVELGTSGVVNPDQWDGYRPARDRLVEGMRESGATNIVVVTGDIHAAVVGDVGTGEDDAVATELVGMSVSSRFPPDLGPSFELAASLNPRVRFGDAAVHGYVVCEATPELLRADYRVVGDVTERATGISTLATFEIADGVPGAIRRD